MMGLIQVALLWGSLVWFLQTVALSQASSFTRLLVHAGGLLGPQLGLLAGPLPPVTSLCGMGFLTAWWLGF